MSEQSAPTEALASVVDGGGDAPPVAARPAEEPADPVRELTRLAEQLARVQNRRLLVEYLRCRRNLR